MNYAKNCPALQYLTLHCPMPIEKLTLPPLRNLKLLDCRLQCTKWLVDYGEDMRKDGAWSTFGMLEIEGCCLVTGSWEDICWLRIES